MGLVIVVTKIYKFRNVSYPFKKVLVFFFFFKVLPIFFGKKIFFKN